MRKFERTDDWSSQQVGLSHTEYQCIIARCKQTNKQTKTSLFPQQSLPLGIYQRGVWLRPPGCEGHLLIFFFWRFPSGCVHTSKSITWHGSGDTPHPPLLCFRADSLGTQVHLPLCELLTCCQRYEEVGGYQWRKGHWNSRLLYNRSAPKRELYSGSPERLLCCLFNFCSGWEANGATRDYIMARFSDTLNRRLHKSRNAALDRTWRMSHYWMVMV